MSLSVASLHVYPIKSLGGFSVDEARTTDRGFENDRRWMLVDADGNFMSQRSLAKMACLHCSPVTNGFRVTDVRDGGTIDLPWGLGTGDEKSATVWDDVVRTIHAPASISAWFEKKLGDAVALVYMPDRSERPVDTSYAQGITSLSDGFPYLIVSQSSLDDLNERGASWAHEHMTTWAHVPMDRFRPNLVIAGGTAFQEDDRKRLSISDVHFDLVKPCARCVITTTDQTTGERGAEPLRTLATYRRRKDSGSKVDFGMNAMATVGGTVRVGDLVQA